MTTEYKYSGLTEKIIKCFYSVYNELEYGFLEKVYQNALVYEFQTDNSDHQLNQRHHVPSKDRNEIHHK